MITLIAQPFAWGQEAAQPSTGTKAADELPRENIRLVLEISTSNQPPATFAIVNNGDRCQMNNYADMIQIDDNQIPVIMSFSTLIARTDESSYNVEYTYSLQIPIATQTSVANNEASPQVRRSIFEYRDIRSRSTVSMEIGQALELFRDPQRTVTLELQSLESEPEATATE